MLRQYIFLKSTSYHHITKMKINSKSTKTIRLHCHIIQITLYKLRIFPLFLILWKWYYRRSKVAYTISVPWNCQNLETAYVTARDWDKKGKGHNTAIRVLEDCLRVIAKTYSSNYWWVYSLKWTVHVIPSRKRSRKNLSLVRVFRKSTIMARWRWIFSCITSQRLQKFQTAFVSNSLKKISSILFNYHDNLRFAI